MSGQTIVQAQLEAPDESIEAVRVGVKKVKKVKKAKKRPLSIDQQENLF